MHRKLNIISKRLKSFIQKSTVISLIFLFAISPLAPVFAADEFVAPAPSDTIVTGDISTSNASSVATPLDTVNNNISAPAVPDTESGNVVPLASPEKAKDTKQKDKGKDGTGDVTAQAQTATATTGASADSSKTFEKARLPQSEGVSGALTYNYPIDVPPGRNGMQPDISLSYNNQAGEEGSVIGYGWSLSIPYIERINRKGTDKLYTENYFNSSLTGELINMSGTIWNSKVDNGEYLKYEFTNNTWLVTDKKGTKYKFGFSAATRQDDPTDSSKVYKWMLEEIRDTNDNYMRYEYFKDAGQIYPSRVVYIGNGATDGIFEVEFLRESRTDATTSYRTGFSVKTNYRINEIYTKVSGSWVKKYTLTYVVGGNTQRSMFKTITESGRDESGNIISLPETSFDYQVNNTGTWTSSNTLWKSPIDLKKGVIVADFNGDSLADIMQSYSSSTPPNGITIINKAVYLNNGNGGWISNDSLKSPVIFSSVSGDNESDLGVRSADINGDGLTDLVQSYSNQNSIHKMFINTGSGWIERHLNDIPAFGSAYSSEPLGTAFVELNGDGLPDVTGGYINNGNNDWILNGTKWSSPVTEMGKGGMVADLNGDGLSDIMKSFGKTTTTESNNYYTSTQETYINDGKGGWIKNDNLKPPVTFYNEVSAPGEFYSFESGVRAADVNGDGFTDLIQASSLVHKIFINTGNSWIEKPLENFLPFVTIYGTSKPDGTHLADINGDGLVDAIQSFTCPWCNPENSLVGAVALNSGPKSDILNKINYSKGGNTTVTYKPSAQYMNGSTLLNPNLPFVLDTVYSITNNDGLGGSYSSTYKYESGKYYFANTFDRKFSGFGKITQTDDAGHSVKTYYHQGDTTDSAKGEYQDDPSKIGKPYRTEISDSYGNIYSTTINKWENNKTILNNNFPATGLRGYWSLNDGTGMIASDSSGNGYNGNLSYLMTNSNWVPAIDQTGLSVSDGRVTIPYNVYSDDISISFWMKAGIYGTTAENILGNKQGDYYSEPYSLMLGNDQSLIWTLAKAYNVTHSGTINNFFNANKTETGWTHIVLTKSGNKLTIYGNGTAYLLPDYPFADMYQSSNFSFGGKGATLMDEVRVYNRSLTSTEVAALYNNPVGKEKSYNFVKLTQKMDFSYYGPTVHKEKVETYTYNNDNGNLTATTAWGEVIGADDGTFTDTGSDKINTAISYVSNSAAYIYGLPYRENVTDQNSATVKDAWYQYDSLPYGQAVKGNFTQEEKWVVGGGYINSQKSYNSYGLVTQETDPRGNATNYSYDSYNLYPASATNALSQTTQYVYDYSSGKPKQVTDPNNYVFQTVYDGFDRPLEEKQPDITTPTTLVTKTAYAYTDTGNPTSVKKTDYLDAANSVDSYSYFDGLGRIIQTRREAETANTFSVNDFVYHYKGLLEKESLAYFSTGIARTSPAADNSLYISYTYDPLQRIVSKTNSVGTENTTYRHWNYTVTDARGNSKNFYVDAYDRLVRVDEINNGQTYVTTYNYDGAGNLIKITDAAGNVRNFTYNGLGMRLTAEDLHASSDATYGVWSYEYDANGNLVNQIDPKNQTVIYTYDALNRVLTENYTGQSGTEATYTYDNCVNGIGRLCNVTLSPVEGSTVETKEYNALGQISKETKTIDSVNYITEYDYDRQGNQTLITNPDNSQVKYEYNNSGLLEKVSTRESVVSDPNLPNNTNLVGQWTLNEGAGTVIADASGNNNNGTLNNSMTSSDWVSGIDQTALNFDGVSKSASIPDSDLIDFPASGQNFSVSFWVKDNGGNFTDNSILEKWEGSGGFPYAFRYSYTNNSVYWGRYDGANGSAAQGLTPINDGAWHHVVGVKDGANIKIYIDGVYNHATTDTVTGTVTNNSKLYIGSRGNVNQFYNGKVDEIRIYNRALAANEITALYQNPSGSSQTSFTDLVTNFDYSPLGKVTSQSYANGTTTTNTYDATKLYRLTSKVTTISGGTRAQDLAYTYDATGNITRITDNSQTNTKKTTDYTYDNLNRLTSAISTGAANNQNYTEYYSYDAIGNITNKSDQGNYYYSGNEGTRYANPHAVTSTSTTVYDYDRNGNLFWASDGLTNTWNYLNRITQSTKGGTTVNYLYDAGGQRIKYSTPSKTTVYPTKSYNTDGATPIKHIYAQGQVIATIKGSGASAQTYPVSTDHLTGSNVVTNSNGSIEELMDYYPYGDIRLDEKASTFSEQRKYAGHEYDQDTGLSYMNARYYNGKIGRFVSVDPAYLALGDNDQIKAITKRDIQQLLTDPQSLNSYAYARNNPLAYIDPTGEFFLDFIGINISNSQRGVANSFHDLGNYFRSQGYIGHGAGFFSDMAGDVAGNVANVFDPRQNTGTRMFAFGMVALDVGSGGKGNAIKSSGLKISEEAIEFLSKGEKTTDVYLGVRGGIDKYVGIAKDLARRAYQHGDRFERLDQITEGGQLTRGQARAIEQATKVNNPQFENKINSISPNHSYYNDVVNWGQNWLKDHGF